MTLTHAMFGGPIRLSAVESSGYRYTLQDITCRKGKFMDEFQIYHAILLKRSATIAAHEKVARYDGWIRVDDWEAMGLVYTLHILPQTKEALA